MEDVAGAGTGFAIGVNVCHHVMAELALQHLGSTKVDIIDVGTQICQLRRANPRRHAIVRQQAELILCLCQGQP